MRHFLTILIAALLFTFTGCSTCGGTKSTEAIDETNQIEATEAINDGHTAQNSLDYQGVYKGTFEGLAITITLEENTYTKVTHAKEGDKEKAGEYKWNDEGFIVTLADADKPNKFFVAENQLFVVDDNNERIIDAEGAECAFIKE